MKDTGLRDKIKEAICSVPLHYGEKQKPLHCHGCNIKNYCNESVDKILKAFLSAVGNNEMPSSLPRYSDEIDGRNKLRQELRERINGTSR